MRVIDLVEKQRNNEILPMHIKYEEEDLYFDGVTYYDKEGNNDLFDILAMNHNGLTHLYEEVEIIEDNKKIEKLDIHQEKNCKNNWKWKCNGYNISTPQKIIVEKVNEIIDKLNEMDK